MDCKNCYKGYVKGKKFMFYKKFVSILILSILSIMLTMVFGSFTCFGADLKGELCMNGDMELLGTGLQFWNATPNNVEGTIVHSGNKSFRVKSTDIYSKLTVLQTITGTIEGGSYNFSTWIYVNELLSNNGGPGLKLEFLDSNGVVIKQTGPIYFREVEKNKWTNCSITAVAPVGTASVVLHIRLDGGGDIVLDDVSFYGDVTPETLAEHNEIVQKCNDCIKLSNDLYEKSKLYSENAEIIEGFQNPIKNNSFEIVDVSGTRAVDWSCTNNSWGTIASVTNEEAHSGENSLKITSNNVNGTYWARTAVPLVKGDFIPGEEHVLSAWVKYKSVEPNKGAFMKMEPNLGEGELASNDYVFNDHEWHKINFVFTVSPTTTTLNLLVRLRGAGEIYFDDITFGPTVGSKELIELSSDTFFYTERGTGKAAVNIDDSKEPIAEGNYVEFKIKDGETVLKSEIVPAKSNTEWEFDIMTMAEKKRSYILEATYKSADESNITEPKTTEIYRYDRPKALAEDGTYLVDGKPFYPYIAYETIDDYLPLCKELGVNVIRSYSRPYTAMSNMGNIKKMLDDAQANGLKVLVSLYHQPAGYPTMLLRTREIVETFKDHPAVYAWMIMDEPSLHLGSISGIKTYEEMLYWLKQSYIEIRAIDDVHPVYCLETLGQVKNPYGNTSKNCDIFTIDPYASSDDRITTWVNNQTKAAVKAVKNEKPVYSIFATYKMYSSNYELFDGNDARHQMYEAAWAGARGFGLYGFTFETDLDNPLGKMDMYRNKAVWNAYKQIKDSGELGELVDHFMAKNSPVFNEYICDGYRYRTWVKDGNIYLVVLNTKNNDNTVNIDLTSTDGKVKINGFKGVAVNGTDVTNISSDNNLLSLNLTKRQAVMYKLTPILTGVSLTADRTDLKPEDTASLVLTGVMSDGTQVDMSKALITYSSDNEQIVKVDQKGIVTAVGEGTASIKVSVKMDDVTRDADIYITVDGLPPVTTLTTEGNSPHGWYTSNVTITLNVFDNLSGVNTTQYRLENGGDWLAYKVPVIIDQDGIYTVLYRSIDDAGNVEEMKQEIIKIDKTAPLTVPSSSGTLRSNGTYNSHVLVTLAAEDVVSGSGVAMTEYSLDGINWLQYTAPITLTENGIYNISFKSVDNAGNVEGEKNISIQVAMSPDIIATYLIEKIKGMNFEHGIEDSFISKLNNVIQSLKEGNKVSAGNQLNAFMNEVNAQRGKKLSAEQADDLKASADVIISVLYIE